MQVKGGMMNCYKFSNLVVCAFFHFKPYYSFFISDMSYMSNLVCRFLCLEWIPLLPNKILSYHACNISSFCCTSLIPDGSFLITLNLFDNCTNTFSVN